MDDVTEEGFVVELDGKFWGEKYRDARFTEYGWVDIKKAMLVKSKNASLEVPTDILNHGSCYYQEVKKGRVLKIKRITTYEAI